MGRKYHHYGIPTTEEKEGETLVETHDFKFFSTAFDGNRWNIQWHRFPKDHGLPDLVTKVPHIGFLVDDLDEEIKGAKILFGPYEPLPGYRCAMIEDHGVPIELIETSLTNEELTALEKQHLGK